MLNSENIFSINELRSPPNQQIPATTCTLLTLVAILVPNAE